MDIKLLCFTLLSVLLSDVTAHELCLDGNFPGRRYGNEFKICVEYEKYGCCESDADKKIYEKYNSSVAEHTITEECDQMIRKVFCQKCSPKSAHLYETYSNKERTYPRLCRDFCVKLYSVCEDNIKKIFGGDVCDPEAKDTTDYCYPNTDTADGHVVEYDDKEDPDCIPVCAQKIISDTENLIDSAYPPNSVDRLFVVQQDGIIWEFHGGKKLEKPFLDFKSRIQRPRNSDEQGLLSMTFHPDYEKNKYFYLFYMPKVTTGPIEAHVIRLMVSETSSPMKFDPQSEKIILRIEKPWFSHNGGQLIFGNDGYLYITTGDGGGPFDLHGPHGNGQSLTTLLGKILRIDVNTEDGYEIPKDNPFAGSTGDEKKEIYAWGFRNPWRASIDPETGRIFVGDVGQDYLEEINIVENGGNYGWRAYEGDKCFDEELCKMIKEAGEVVKDPIYSYKHDGKKSAVIGGYLYRNAQIKQLKGKYVFGNYNGGYLYALEEKDGVWTKKNICVGKLPCPAGTESVQPWKRLFAFGKDENDEIYVFVGVSSQFSLIDGAMYKLVQPVE